MADPCRSAGEWKAMSEKPIAVLLVENNADDTHEIRRMLREGRGTSFAIECVDRLTTGLERLTPVDLPGNGKR